MEWMLTPFRRYAQFSGRSRRKEYWMFALFLMLAYVAFIVLMMSLGASAFMALGAGGPGAAGALGGGAMLIFGLFGLFWLAVLIPSIAVGVRRLHDIDRSGWWILAPVAPSVLGVVLGDGAFAGLLSVASLVLSVALLVFYCMEGTRGPNRFGPDPKDPAGTADLNEVFR